MSHSESSVKARHWCFTVNNPEQPLDWSAVKGVRYAVYQMESGESGTPHFQGYVEFSTQPRLAALKKILPTAHWEPRRGTRDQARAYCMKDESRLDGPWEFGNWISGQGARSDLATAIESAKQGGMKRLAEEHPVAYVKYHKGIQHLLNCLYPPKPRCPVIELTDQQKHILDLLDGDLVDRRIIWIWSDLSHTGKSTFFKYAKATRDVAIGRPSLRNTLMAYRGQKILWFNIEREVPLDSELISTLEAVSDADVLLSEKFDVCEKLVEAHIVVTTNRPPPHHRIPDRILEFHFDKVVGKNSEQ